jgi:predicted AAA+ superfamily ATPase
MGDIGLRHGFIGYRDKDIGGILENIVFLELLVRGYTVSVGKYDDREIDFIAEKQNKKMYVQVAYLLAAPETVEREFRALEKIEDNYPKVVVSLDRYFVPERKGILWKNLLDFLVEEE